jgi:hypothetical protein
VIHKRCIVATVLVALILAGCTTSTAKPTGIVTGVADACVGIVLAGSTLPHVTVLLYSGSTVVASTTIKSGAKYRFSVTPGFYKVNAQQATPRFQYRPKGVLVRAGQSVTANFPDYCK